MGPLSDPRVIELIARNLIPVATNLYKIRDEKSTAGDFFRAVRKQKDQYQGFWIVAPDGQVLAAHHQFKEDASWTNDVMNVIRQGLQRFGPVAPRDPEPRDHYPFRGKGTRPDGSVSLALYVRMVEKGRAVGQGAYDTIELSAEEWQAFAPPTPAVGTTWPVRHDVACKYSRCLTYLSDQNSMPRPHEVQQVALTGTVREVKRGVAIVTYEGRIAASHAHINDKGRYNRGEATLLGIGTYDLEAREMRYLLMVGSGAYRDFQPYDREARPLKIAIEWQRRTAP